MIRPIAFVDTSTFTGYFISKYRKEVKAGLLELRAIPDGEDAAVDLEILKEWTSARALLERIRSQASVILQADIELGRAWIEVLPPMSGTPWIIEEDDYAQAHLRTRTCLVWVPDAPSMSGTERAVLGVGIVNQVEHKTLCSELNLSTYPRTHLIVDVRKPDQAPA